MITPTVAGEPDLDSLMTNCLGIEHTVDRISQWDLAIA